MKHLINQQIEPGFYLHSIIGSGSFATVFKGIKNNKEYAIKAFSKSKMTSKQLETLKREAKIMKHLSNHPNIVQFYKVIENNDFFFLVMELCEMDLFEAITKQNGFPQEVVKEVFLQLLNALIYCHEMGVYHRDIKPENIMISKDFKVKLCDFGLATTERWSTEFGCGSVRYMAPECMNASKKKKCYSSALNDVWSMGILLINLLFGKNPWHEASEKDQIYNTYITTNPRILRKQFNLSLEGESLFSKIFETSLKKRISLTELKTLIQNIPTFIQPIENTVVKTPELQPRKSIVLHDDFSSTDATNVSDTSAYIYLPSPAESFSTLTNFNLNSFSNASLDHNTQQIQKKLKIETKLETKTEYQHTDICAEKDDHLMDSGFCGSPNSPPTYNFNTEPLKK
ncbi:hypothetical protein HDU92_007004, partial [Lobulomyces angularis]